MKVPERVAEELSESPDTYAYQRDRLRAAQEAGLVEPARGRKNRWLVFVSSTSSPEEIFREVKQRIRNDEPLNELDTFIDQRVERARTKATELTA